MKKIICLIATLFCYLVNQAQDVKTDLDFGDGGKVINDFGRTSTIGVEAISYPDKTIILDIGGREWHKISRTGEKDMSFGDDGVVTLRIRPPHISAIRDDGKIIAFSSYPQGQIGCEVSRFLINAKPDLLFGNKGVIKIYNNLVDSVFSWENRYFKPSKLILLMKAGFWCYMPAPLGEVCEQTALPALNHNTPEWINKTSVIGVGTVVNAANDIRIKQGHDLIVEGTLNMAAETSIIIEKNARLIVSGGTVTNLCGDTWQGVKILDANNTKRNKIVIEKNGGRVVNY